eukprot:1783461-Pleurochrysis_carterae.AAC.1
MRALPMIDMEDNPKALDITTLAPLYLSFRNKCMLGVLPIGIPNDISVSPFSIQPGVDGDPVTELVM